MKKQTEYKGRCDWICIIEIIQFKPLVRNFDRFYTVADMLFLGYLMIRQYDHKVSRQPLVERKIGTPNYSIMLADPWILILSLRNVTCVDRPWTMSAARP